jgi:hypothetical protein
MNSSENNDEIDFLSWLIKIDRRKKALWWEKNQLFMSQKNKQKWFNKYLTKACLFLGKFIFS